MPNTVRKKAKRRKPLKTIFVNRTEHRIRVSFKTFFTIFLIFIGGVGSALTYAVIADTQRQITNTRTALTEQRETNVALRAEITQRYTMDEVAQIAVERLGMGPPDASQVIRIHVPKQSYVVLNDEDIAEETEHGFLDALAAFVVDFFGEALDVSE